MTEPKQKERTALLLIGLGTPDDPSVPSVRRYLKQFLGDKRVIDLPWLFRKLLVNGIIVPFWAAKSARLYRRLWTEEGSPLMIHTQRLQQKLQARLEGEMTVFAAMRYQHPSVEAVIGDMLKEPFDRFILLPLYPQYASSTTLSSIEAVRAELERRGAHAEVSVIEQFYDHPAFIDAFVQRIASCRPEEYDHILFSYHGLPVSHTDKCHPGIRTVGCPCDRALPEHGKRCYRATCYETTRLLAKRLGLTKERYSVSFQSRLSDTWLKPFTDRALTELSARGVKRLLVVAPSFTADCLETIIEIGEDYRTLFLNRGGETFTLVKSLNDTDEWVEALRKIVS